MSDMRWCLLFLVGCASQGAGSGDPLDQGAADGYDSSAAVKRENAVAKLFDNARNDPSALAKLVAALPKGGDLHMHLSGAATSEALMAMGESDNDCVSQRLQSHATRSRGRNGRTREDIGWQQNRAWRES